MRYINRKEFTSELAKISLSNEDITRYGDGFETLPYQNKLKLNQSRKGKLSTTTPLFYIYCCSAFLLWKN